MRAWDSQVIETTGLPRHPSDNTMNLSNAAGRRNCSETPLQKPTKVFKFQAWLVARYCALCALRAHSSTRRSHRNSRRRIMYLVCLQGRSCSRHALWLMHNRITRLQRRTVRRQRYEVGLQPSLQLMCSIPLSEKAAPAGTTRFDISLSELGTTVDQQHELVC